MIARRRMLFGATALLAAWVVPAFGQDRRSADFTGRSNITTDDLDRALRDLGIYPADPVVAGDGTTPPAQPVAPPAQPVVPAAPPGTEASLQIPIPFSINSAQLRPDARALVAIVADLLLRPAYAARSFLVEGHTDISGAYAFNLDLSRRRAESVVAVLVQLGVARNRLTAIGVGPNKLIGGLAPTDPRHRRVELVTIA